MIQPYKFGFIILHYLSIEDTFKCVESIEQLDGFQDCMIFIVDNASPDQSGSALSKKYESINHIKVILLEKNLGFSEANNIAYRMMKSSYKIDFLIAANNDIQFVQRDFLTKLKDISLKSKFFILGPDIQVKGNRHQNPKSPNPMSYSEAQKWLSYVTFQFNHINLFLMGKLLAPYKRRLKKLFKISPSKDLRLDGKLPWDKVHHDVCLCGACLIFSADFIDYYQDLFSPVTFFYHEEDILFTKMKINQHKTIYDPSIYVFHNNAVSTGQALKNMKKRYRFQFGNNIQSCKIYLDYLEQNKLM